MTYPTKPTPKAPSPHSHLSGLIGDRVMVIMIYVLMCLVPSFLPSRAGAVTRIR